MMMRELKLLSGPGIDLALRMGLEQLEIPSPVHMQWASAGAVTNSTLTARLI